MMEGGSDHSDRIDHTDHTDRSVVPVQLKLLHQSPEVSKLFASCYNFQPDAICFATALGSFIL